jgi:hypothetical protein
MLRCSFLYLSCTVVLFSGCAKRPVNPPANPVVNASATPAAEHLLAIVEIGPQGARLVTSHVVPLPLPVMRQAPDDPWLVEVEDSKGRKLFSTPIPAADALRGEFPGPGGTIEAAHLQQPVSSFAVRLPVRADAHRIRFWNRRPLLPAKPPASTSLPDPGSPEPPPVELGVIAYPGQAP